MVTGLPAAFQDDEKLADFYESLGCGNVESAHVSRHVRSLERYIDQRTHALRVLEEVYTEYYGNPSGVLGYDPEKIEADCGAHLPSTTSTGDHPMDDTNATESSSLLRPSTIPGKKRPTMRLGFLGLSGKKVDKIDHCREVFITLDKAVQKKRLARVFPTTTTGFVTFEGMHSAQILSQTVNTRETLSCYTVLAPEPRDVFWDNLNLPPSELGVRSIVVNTTVFFLIFFWSGPIGLFSSFLNLDSLEKLIPGVSEFAEANPLLKELIQGFLPTVGVSVFLAVVPKILEALCENQGIQSHSAVHRSMYNKYFTFILFNVFLVFTVVGTWAQAFNKVYHNLGELTLILAASLPRIAPFFVNYTILKGIGLMPLQLLEIGDVLVQGLKGFLSKTPRDYAEARAPPELKYGVVYSNTTLMFVIILIYSCIKPLILVFGVIYFGMAYLVYKYQLLYVFFHPYESCGQAWPMVYNRIMVGLLIFQSTMLGLFMLKQAYIFGCLLAPLPIGTIWFWAWTSQAYHQTAHFIPLQLLRPEEIRKVRDNFNEETYEDIPIGTANDQTNAQTNVQSNAKTVIQVGNNSQASIQSGANNTVGNGTPVSNGAATSTAMANTLPTTRVSRRRVPRNDSDSNDYQAIPDRYTDYRQPPMTLYPGVLNSGMRHYSHPAISGPLPTLWLPLKKTDTGKKPANDEESRIGLHSDSDSDSDAEGHEHSIEAALAKRPLMLPSQTSDEPMTFEESDNLVGGGQDEDHSNHAATTTTVTDAGAGAGATSTVAASGSSANAGTGAGPSVNTTGANSKAAETVLPRSGDVSPSTATSPLPIQTRGPQAIVGPTPLTPTTPAPEQTLTKKESVKAAAADKGVDSTTLSPVVSDSSSSAAATATATPNNEAVTGIQDIYYHHPERMSSGTGTAVTTEAEGSTAQPTESEAETATFAENTSRVRTVQGQGSVVSLKRT
ncbi:hypothetical protein BGW38_002601 [Lunasporangiospora selenospora]|uniref:CSC1/OSCA1-like 7TM region domain-containing protein n=1 Tax=Lunasporangiospora selenospora TaxID=979761 RepID=A0A9P6KD96_9FUNG|nr:hypothetical protein BGW38_002601 [Lunasporangiospora selenospora]